MSRRKRLLEQDGLDDSEEDWCVANNCSERWALRWKQVEDELKEAEVNAIKNKENEVPSDASSIAMERDAALALYRAKQEKFSLWYSQELANEEWSNNIREIEQQKLKRQMQNERKFLKDMTEEKRCAYLAKRLKEFDAEAVRRGIKAGKPTQITTKEHDAKPGPAHKPDEQRKKPPETGKRSSDGGQRSPEAKSAPAAPPDTANAQNAGETPGPPK